MKKNLLLLPLVLCVVLIRVNAQTSSTAAVVKLDPALDELISTDAKLELVKDGFGSTEGPNWVQTGKTGYLVFTDIFANVIYKMTPDGKTSVLVDHAGYRGFDPWNAAMERTNLRDPKDPLFRVFLSIGADGLSLDRQGRIISATFVGRSIERIDKRGRRTTLADNYEGKRFSGPNDVVVKRDGAIYFTDMGGGVIGRGHDPKEELPPQGIYMIKDGKVTFVIKDIPTPNGLAFSPDEKYLYANGSFNRYIRRYDVQSDDTVTNGKLIVDMSADKTPGITDGMRVDSKGNIYSTGPGGVWIVSPEGKHLGTILVPMPTPFYTVANLCFGDADLKTLYLTAHSYIYRIRVITPGHRVF